MLAKMHNLPPATTPVRRELYRRTLAERSLREFVRQAWHIVEPATEFVPNWHIDAICDHLQAVSDGRILRLLINIPPRCMKSLIVAVMWPCWDWITRPSRRWLFASYAAVLSTRDSVKCRRLLSSRWYQARWGDRFRLTGDQNEKMRFENDRTGYRIATSISGVGTGEGAGIRVFDDPHNAKEAESAAARAEVLEWFTQSWPTRGNDWKTSASVGVMQRVHWEDVVGHIIDTDYERWDHLCLPMEYEPEHPTPCRTTLGFKDPRRVRGELLWPARFGAAELAPIKRELGRRGVAGQFQQMPAPREGNIWRQEYLDHHYQWSPARDRLLYDGGEVEMYHLYRFATVDLALGKRDSDQTVIGLWGFDSDARRLFLLHIDRKDYPAPETLARLRRYVKEWNLDEVFVESVQYQGALVQFAADDALPFREISPGREDKVARLRACEPWGEQGRFLFDAKARWFPGFERELLMFAGVPGEADDQVDVLSYAGRVAMEYCGVRDPSPWQAAAGVARKKREMTL